MPDDSSREQQGCELGGKTAFSDQHMHWQRNLENRQDKAVAMLCIYLQ